MNRLAWAQLLAATAALSACSPWSYGEGDFFAGTVDATNYPADYQFGTEKEAAGSLSPVVAATLSSSIVLTYNLAMPAAQTAGADENGIPELALALEPVDLVGYAPPSPATVFNFDPTASEPFATPQKCTAPTNYVFDARLEGYRKDYQGPIFTALPDEGSVPYLAEVAVSTKAMKCQTLKDQERLLKSKDVTVPITKATAIGEEDSPTPSGKLVLYYPVNPRVSVEPADQNTGFGAQMWGWFNHYLFAYIDGGYLPTQQFSIDTGEVDPDTMAPILLEFEGIRPQHWYYPATRPGALRDPDTGEISFPIDPDTGEYNFVAAGGPGLSNRSAAFAGAVTDLVDAARGEAGYSPVCELCEYEGTTADWQAFIEDGNPLPLFANIANPVCTGVYVYCPQQAE